MSFFLLRFNFAKIVKDLQILKPVALISSDIYFDIAYENIDMKIYFSLLKLIEFINLISSI